jgi:hypothetical protein
MTSADRFKKALQALAPKGNASTGRWILVPGAHHHDAESSFERSQRRRTWILQGLLGGVGLTFVAAVAWSPFWNLQLTMDFALALYVVFLIEAKRRRAERMTRMRELERFRRSDSVEWADSVEWHEARVLGRNS